MEDKRSIRIVGNYRFTQAQPEDCLKCHNAKWATVLIDSICIDCYRKKVIEKEILEKVMLMAQQSLSPEKHENLAEAIEWLIKNRHLEMV